MTILRKIKSLLGVKNEPKKKHGPAASPASREKPKNIKSKPNEKKRRISKAGTGNKKPKKAKSQKLPVHERRTVKKPDKLLDVEPAEGKARFLDFPIAEDVLFGIQDLKFKYCTPIQQQSLAALLEGRDLCGKAQTGTGKTAAFLIAGFSRMLKQQPQSRENGSCRMLVLAPTRELALQIYKDAEALGKYTSFNNLVVFGGMDHKGQRERLSEPIDLLVGTPGRLIDYMQSSHLKLSNCEILVIDEADRMLDMGFIPDVKRIVARMPKAGQRQTMFFSATLDDNVMRLASSWLHEPETVESEPEQLITDLVEQKFFSVAASDKLALLLNIVSSETISRMLIFGNRKDRNMHLFKQLSRYGISCELLSGDVPQHKRMKILERFRKGTTRIIIATDVAARGIHVDDVSHVVNYELPEHPEDYVHRVGRTGRAGRKGTALSFVCEYGAYMLPMLEELSQDTVHCILPDEAMLKLPPRVPQKKSSERPPSRRRRG